MERMATKILCLFWVALLASTTTVKEGNLAGCEEDNGQMKKAYPDVAAADEVFFSQVETVFDAYGDKATISKYRKVKAPMMYIPFYKGYQ